jgi:hypothetical protein
LHNALSFDFTLFGRSLSLFRGFEKGYLLLGQFDLRHMIRISIFVTHFCVGRFVIGRFCGSIVAARYSVIAERFAGGVRDISVS